MSTPSKFDGSENSFVSEGYFETVHNASAIQSKTTTT